MPGNIHVSVLGFKGISISSVQIKASMGKTEFQIWEKGDFSFPLTTLRDNLIIILHDAEGNQISHAGVRTMSIVEKGVWDDLFPLEGGGQIHMKLQFVLSDEERNRIRMMREIALKKKQREILNSTPRDAETASNSTSSLPTNEVSDSRTSSVIPNALKNAGEVAVRADHFPKPDNVRKTGESHNASRETPNATDRKEELPQKPLEVKVENELPRPNNQVGPILSQEASSSFMSSEAVVAEKKSVQSRVANDQDEKPEKPSPVDKTDAKEKSERKEITNISMSRTPHVQHADTSIRLKESPEEIKIQKSEDAEKTKSVFPKVSDENKRLQKAPSNIRKMISAFESSLAQEHGPTTKSMAEKSQSNRFGMVRLLKDQVCKGSNEMSESSSGRLENPAVLSLGRLKNSFSAGDLQRIPSNILKKGEPTSFQKDFGGFKSSQAVEQFKGSSAKESQQKETDTVFLKELRQAQRDIIRKKIEKSLGDTKRLLSATEEATFSGRKEEEINSAENLVIRSELKSAPTEIIEKEMEKYKLPSPLEEATVSGRTSQEKDSAGISIVENVFGSNKDVNMNELNTSDSITNFEDINTNELATSDLMGPSTLKAAKVPGNVHEVGERDSRETSFVKQEIGSSQKESNRKGTEISPRDLEAGALSGTIGVQEDSSGKLIVEGREKRISSTKISNEINIRGVSKDDLEYFPSERNSLGACVVGEKSDRRKKIPIEPENIGKDLVQSETDAEVKNTEEKSNSSRNSEQERSRDDASTGHLGQIIKIAVVIGFGLLVLLTRQRQPRNAKRKDNDPPPFGIETCINQKIPIEERLKKIDIF